MPPGAAGACGDHPPADLLPLRVQAWAAAATPSIAASFRTGFEELRGAIAAAIERGQRSGGVAREIDADAAPRIVIALLQGLVLQIVNGTGVDPESYGKECASLIERALREAAPA